MDFALWTRQAVLQLIKRRCGMRLPPRRRPVPVSLGFILQKPIRRAYAQRAKVEGADIH